MWRTADGSRLKILRSDLGRVGRRWRQALRGSRPIPGQGSPRADLAALRPLARLARGARQIGVIRRPGCGCSYPVFASRLGGDAFHVVTRPLRGGSNAIVSIRIVVRGR